MSIVMAPRMANPDFMRFSSGVFTRDQTQGFLNKIVDWQIRGLPSQFALIHRGDGRLIGFCGFFSQVVDEKNEVEIAYRLHPDYWNDHAGTMVGALCRRINSRARAR